jgi:hypothetical protein
MSRRITLAFLMSGLWACAGSSSAPPMPPTPDTGTLATLAGPLCESSACRCTDDPAAAGEAPEGFKRFKVVLGPTEGELWGMIDGNLFYKSRERAVECYYVDLETGDHPISLRAKGRGGFGARMLISEIGAAGPWFYDSFEFACGAPGLCDHQGLRNWKRRVAAVDAGKHAPCGSVRIFGIDWQTGRMPDNVHPEDFFLQASMKIYPSLPNSPPGTATCTK